MAAVVLQLSEILMNVASSWTRLVVVVCAVCVFVFACVFAWGRPCVRACLREWVFVCAFALVTSQHRFNFNSASKNPRPFRNAVFIVLTCASVRSRALVQFYMSIKSAEWNLLITLKKIMTRLWLCIIFLSRKTLNEKAGPYWSRFRGQIQTWA